MIAFGYDAKVEIMLLFVELFKGSCTKYPCFCTKYIITLAYAIPLSKGIQMYEMIKSLLKLDFTMRTSIILYQDVVILITKEMLTFRTNISLLEIFIHL